MDDCNLSKLTVNPGILSPIFNKDVTDYRLTVSSSAEKITFDPQTSDNGASFSISNSGGTRDVPLKEGVITDIKIEVTSEDGHIKCYFVHVKRLSSKDASLTSLTVQNGSLEPEFSPNQEIYFCLLPSNTTAATVTAIAPDHKNVVDIIGSPPNTPVPLNVGLTIVNIEVTSPDQSYKKIYKLEIVRKQIPRYVKFTNSKAALEFECPISLSPLYCPITVRGSNPRCSYSGPSINELTRTSKVDPLTGQPLQPGWAVQDISLEKEMALQIAAIPLTYSGSSQPSKFDQLANHLGECDKPAKLEDQSGTFSAPTLTLNRELQSFLSNPEKNTELIRLLASVNGEVFRTEFERLLPYRGYKPGEHKWQKALQQVFDEINPSNLVQASETYLKEYYSRIPKPGHFHQQYNEGESPIDSLQNAIYCLATAIKFKPKDASLHYELAMTLEERYLAEDMYGLKKEEKEEAPSLNLKAKESSKEEEVFAICKLKGVDPSAPISHHLQALDAEYHHLLDTQQSGKADHVQSLYVWYSKKVSQEGAAAHKAEDNQTPLGQAYQKYLDALCIEESSDIYNFHVGRILVIMGNYEDAIKRLEVSLSKNSKHAMARFYLGLAISLSKEEWKMRGKDAIKFLLAGMEMFLAELSKQANKPEEVKSSLFADNLLRVNNVHLLRGIIQLGNLLMSNSDVKEAISPTDVFHTAALLAAQILPTICRGDLYKQVEWVLVDAHSQLLELLTKKQAGSENLISSRCQNLSALIFNSTISGNAKLLELQEKTCQKLVKIQPCVSYTLFLLGSAQFALFENSPDGNEASQKLKDAKDSYKACIELEGKSASGNPPEQITKQRWWTELVKSENDAKKATDTPKGSAVSAPPPAGSVHPSNEGKVVGRGRGVAANQATSNNQAKGDKSKHISVPQARKGRGGAVAAKGGKPAASPVQVPIEKPSPKTELDRAVVETAPTSEKVAPINVKSYQPRLGLARVLRASNEPNEAKKYYAQVIDMAPEVHDAYIENAEMLSKSDPLEAVNVYSRFPVSANPSYDDAFIFGEIVRILMKAEKFDDERLPKNMIAYGKVLGIVVLDNYTKILEQKHKNEILRKVYAGINNKSVDDPDMQAFFKFKFWL